MPALPVLMRMRLVLLDGLVPVIVYIYGGSFTDGSSNLYSPDYFMESHKVVVVSIAYRLGAFGFLYLDDPIYPANLGIRDQILALRWIQKNVRHFGGDPNRVTIAGQSAGAASVSILMHSNAAKGLFIGAISESGTDCSLWAVQPRCTGIQRLRMLAEKLNCTAYPSKESRSSNQIVKCLRSKSSKEISEKTKEFLIYDRFVPFPPIKESTAVKNPVISTFPWHKDTEFADLVPWITGVNSNEGSNLVAGGLPTSKLSLLGLIISTPFFLPDFLFYLNTASDPVKVTEDIILNNIELYAQDYNTFLTKIVTENDFFYPMVKCLSKNVSPSYSYYFNYISSEEQGKVIGVGHSGELKYLWPTTFRIRVSGSQKDKDISNYLVNTWIDFTYNQSVNLSSQWVRYDSKMDNVLIIDNDGIKMGTNPNQEVVDFWRSLNMSNRPNTNDCN